MGLKKCFGIKTQGTFIELKESKIPSLNCFEKKKKINKGGNAMNPLPDDKF